MKPKHLDCPLVAGCTIGHLLCFQMGHETNCKLKVHISPTEEFCFLGCPCCTNVLFETLKHHDWLWISLVVVGGGGAPPVWDGIALIRDIVAHFLNSGRKWRHVIHFVLIYANGSIFLGPMRPTSVTEWLLEYNERNRMCHWHTCESDQVNVLLFPLRYLWKSSSLFFNVDFKHIFC